MTNFEKMKPSLGVLFKEDMTLEEFAEFISMGHAAGDCSLCKLEKYCDHMMAFDDPDHEEKYPLGNGVSCEDVIASFLEKEADFVK